MRYVDYSGHSPVVLLRLVEYTYCYSLIDDETMTDLVLTINTLTPYCAFHELTQVYCAKQIMKYEVVQNLLKDPFYFSLFNEMIVPSLEHGIWIEGHRKEADIIHNGKIWEVKPAYRSADKQLDSYCDATKYERGYMLFGGRDVYLKLPFNNITMVMSEKIEDKGMIYYSFFSSEREYSSEEVYQLLREYNLGIVAEGREQKKEGNTGTSVVFYAAAGAVYGYVKCGCIKKTAWLDFRLQ